MTAPPLPERTESSKTPEQVDWQIGVFCQNEGERLGDCLRSIDAAVGGREALITIILNGSTDNSLAVARAAAPTLRTPVRIFVIDAGDKSNAINHYIGDPGVRVDADLYFAIDGYAVINPGGLTAMEAALAASPGALAASAMAGNGRTSPLSNHQTAAIGGVFRGQFNCMTAAFVQRLQASGVRLPVGLYRGDGLLGSIAAHDLDPVKGTWNNSRVIGVVDAVFMIQSLSPFRLRDLRRHFNRKVRQMRGLLENAAIRTIAHERGFEALPAHADDMIRDYLASSPAPAISSLDRPFMALALRRHRRATSPDLPSLEPRRVL